MKAYWPKILPLGTCGRYLKRYGHQRPGLHLRCSNQKCHGRTLHGHGRYFRMAIFKSKDYRIPIYRWRCPSCARTFSILPDFLTPEGHFAIPVREAALKRKAQGVSFNRIAESIIQGGISHKTIKRWWKWYLYKAAGAAWWLAAELIRVGVDEDLLRLHTGGIHPTPRDTSHWLIALARKYLSRLHLNPEPWMGYFGFLNTRLPANQWI